MSKQIKIILSIVAIIIVAGLAYTFWPSKPADNGNNQPSARQEQLDNNITLTPKSVLSYINKNLFNNVYDVKNKFVDWVLDDASRICLTDGMYLKIDYDSTLIKDINKKISLIFNSLGFTENLINMQKEKQYKQDYRMGFEKDNIRCSIIWSSIDEFYEIRCGVLTDHDLTNYENFYNLINTKKNKDILVCVEKQNNEYAIGITGGWRGGAKWYAKKEKRGGWKLLLKTQEGIDCLLANQLPKGFYELNYCYQDGNKVFIKN